MGHNDYIFSKEAGEFRFLRRFEDMYRNCDDPHGQSCELERLDYQLVTIALRKILSGPRDSDRPARVLDLGCGLGFFTSHVKSLFPSAEVSGCDISTTALEKARRRSPDCTYFPIDLKLSQTLPARTYDVVIALDVLYYFTDVEIADVVMNVGSLVEVGGFLLAGYHLPEEMSFGRYIRGLNDARELFTPRGFEFCLTLDVNNSLDTTYSGDVVGRHIYFVAQKV